MIRRGQEGEYQWVETPLPQLPIGDIVVPLHIGCRLAVVSFDSGPIRPDEQEQEAGWRAVGQAMVSPPLHAAVNIPEAGFDEWYIVDSLLPEAWMPERFITIISFTLAPVSELVAAQDSMWDRRGWDWLIPVQERFWDQLQKARPVTYVAASHQHVIVVSRRRDVVEAFEHVASQS
jgi:hypothetical protein